MLRAVLDIDETTLSNWACLDEVDFEQVRLANCVLQSRSSATSAVMNAIATQLRNPVYVST
jgi:hypothetical protein